MNGAYIGSKTVKDVEVLAQAQGGAIVVGSISIKPRQANSGHGYWRHKEGFYSLNSYGMPNGGLPYFKKQLPVMVELAHGRKKPLVANLIGFSEQEFVDLIQLSQISGADMAELNFGCPNVWDEGKQKLILSYHAEQIAETLAYIKKSKPRIPICIKISPLPPDLLREVCQAIISSKIVRVITATNSYPNAMTAAGTKKQDEEILAGLTGRALKPISLGVVKQLRTLLPPEIDIIGCGGISSCNDVTDFLSAGAKAVQIATALVDDGPGVFEKIIYQSTKA